jgi:hypothetical protein
VTLLTLLLGNTLVTANVLNEESLSKSDTVGRKLFVLLLLLLVWGSGGGCDGVGTVVDEGDFVNGLLTPDPGVSILESGLSGSSGSTWGSSKPSALMGPSRWNSGPKLNNGNSGSSGGGSSVVDWWWSTVVATRGDSPSLTALASGISLDTAGSVVDGSCCCWGASLNSTGRSVVEEEEVDGSSVVVVDVDEMSGMLVVVVEVISMGLWLISVAEVVVVGTVVVLDVVVVLEREGGISSTIRSWFGEEEGAEVLVLAVSVTIAETGDWGASRCSGVKGADVTGASFDCGFISLVSGSYFTN